MPAKPKPTNVGRAQRVVYDRDKTRETPNEAPASSACKEAVEKQRTGGELEDHYLDSGPLFCLGGSQVLAELFEAHFLPKSRVASAVVSEVKFNADLMLPAVGHHAKRKVKQAARVATGRFKALLQNAKESPDVESQLFKDIANEADILAQSGLEAGEAPHPRKNDGETESVYWASMESVQIVANDKDAHLLAGRRGVESVSFVDVARQLVRAQKLVKRKEIYGELAQLGKDNIFVGEHITGELDLV